MSDLNLITLLQDNFTTKNVSTPAKMSINYNPHNISHFLLLQNYFPAGANWLKLVSYMCMYTPKKGNYLICIVCSLRALTWVLGVFCCSQLVSVTDKAVTVC